MSKYLLFFLLGLNLIAFLAYLTDKLLARANRRRISEKHLHLASFLGGIGALAGIFLIRHKSAKAAFLIISIPLILLHFGLWYLAMRYTSW